jgi:DNA repair protein RecN (Recombination protein N)
VFDEVDAGVGGAAAVAVGAALAELGAETQVLVVTHLAQVAAPATTQLLVSKDVSRNITVTSVAQVDGEERVVEIARMLAGDDSTAAREHARELLNR